jgi:hypothetical protein
METRSSSGLAAVQVIHGEPQGLLCGGVAANLDIAALPAARPRRLVRLDHAPPAVLTGAAERVAGFRAGIALRCIRPDHGDGAREAHHLRGATGPCPGVLQDAARSRRNVLAIDAQMRRRGDGEALAGTACAPQAEILIEPFGDEPEIDAFKRGFQRDLDLSLLDFELDQL